MNGLQLAVVPIQAKNSITPPMASDVHVGAFSRAVTSHTPPAKQDVKAKTRDPLYKGDDKPSLSMTAHITAIAGKSPFRQHDESKSDGKPQSAILPTHDIALSEPMSAPSAIMTAELTDTLKAMMLDGGVAKNSEIYVSFSNSQSLITEVTIKRDEVGKIVINISTLAGNLKFVQGQLTQLRKQLAESGVDIDEINLSADDDRLLPVMRDDGKKQ